MEVSVGWEKTHPNPGGSESEGRVGEKETIVKDRGDELLKQNNQNDDVRCVSQLKVQTWRFLNIQTYTIEKHVQAMKQVLASLAKVKPP